MGERIGIYRILVEKPEGNGPPGRTRLRLGITLRWIFRKWEVGIRTRSSWLRIRTCGGHL
jgi:hypothetical protein